MARVIAKLTNKTNNNMKQVTVTAMNFGQALETLKLGGLVSREGWNGKGMHLELVKAADYQIDGHNLPVKQVTTKGESNQSLLPFIMMKTADDKYVPWLASQTDVLAEDWCQLSNA